MTTPRKPAASSRRPTAHPAPKATPTVSPSVTPVAVEPVAVAPEPAAPAPVVVVAEPAVASPVIPEAVAPAPEPEVAPAITSDPFPKFKQGHSIMATAEQTFASAKEQFEKFSKGFMSSFGNGFGSSFGGFGDFASVGRENVEAFVKASTIFVKGTEEIGKSVAALTQSQVEASLATTKALMGVTNFKQAIELQNEAAKTSFDKLMSEGNKITELSMKVANEAIEPIQARVTLAVEKIMKPAA
jgi:phasin family protein